MGPTRIQVHAKNKRVVALYATPEEQVISIGEDGTVFVFDPATRNKVAQLDRHPNQHAAVLFLPDNKRAVTVCRELIQVWQRAGWKRLQQIERYGKATAALLSGGAGTHGRTEAAA